MPPTKLIKINIYITALVIQLTALNGYFSTKHVLEIYLNYAINGYDQHASNAVCVMGYKVFH